MVLPPSPADFQMDYSSTKKNASHSYTMKQYRGPAISSSVPTWGTNQLLGPTRPRMSSSNLPPIPDSPNRSSDDVEIKSLTALTILSDDSKESGRAFRDRRIGLEKHSREKFKSSDERNFTNDAQHDEDDDEDDVE